MRVLFRLVAVAVSIGLVAGAVPAWAARGDAADITVPSAIAQALADGQRHAKPGVDKRRRPGPILAFAGVKSGDTVIELIPGTGYWTRILSKVVGPSGHIYAIFPSAVAQHHPDSLTAMRQLMATPRYDNVTVMLKPAAHLANLAVPPADLVFTAENLHDFNNAGMGHITPRMFAESVRGLLKPGGVLLVNDHVAPAGAGLADTATLHRIDPALVKRQIVAAGFRFDGSLDVLANPADPHDIPIFDQTIRGHTDQFVYRFVKPQAPTSARGVSEPGAAER